MKRSTLIRVRCTIITDMSKMVKPALTVHTRPFFVLRAKKEISKVKTTTVKLSAALKLIRMLLDAVLRLGNL